MMFHECTFFVFTYTKEHNTKDQPEWMALEPLIIYFSPVSHKRGKKKKKTLSLSNLGQDFRHFRQGTFSGLLQDDIVCQRCHVWFSS